MECTWLQIIEIHLNLHNLRFVAKNKAFLKPAVLLSKSVGIM